MTDDELDAAIGISNARETAEQQLLAILRDPGAPLALTVSHDGGRWLVRLGDTGDGAGSATGEGRTFAEAWHRITPGWAPQNDNPQRGR